MQLFGGVINDGNPRLPGSAIAENEYPNLHILCLSLVSVEWAVMNSLAEYVKSLGST